MYLLSRSQLSKDYAVLCVLLDTQINYISIEHTPRVKKSSARTSILYLQKFRDAVTGTSVLVLYKYFMINASDWSLLNHIAIGKECLYVTFSGEGILSMKLAKRIMVQSTNVMMRDGLVSIYYEGEQKSSMTVQKLYRVQDKLKRTHLHG